MSDDVSPSCRTVVAILSSFALCAGAQGGRTPTRNVFISPARDSGRKHKAWGASPRLVEEIFRARGSGGQRTLIVDAHFMGLFPSRGRFLGLTPQALR
jgi:hypothetical protein